MTRQIELPRDLARCGILPRTIQIKTSRGASTATKRSAKWPAPGSADTELGVLMELEVGHGEAEVYAGVQA
jgi:hypothetical protein